MKRLLTVLLILCLFIWGGALADAAPLTEADFELAYAGGVYALGTDPAPLLAAMEKRDGEKPEVFEAESCLFQGKDKEITGQELILATYPMGPGGRDLLETIVIYGGPWVTCRGIGVGSAKDEVISAYGEQYRMDYDQMVYAVGEPYESPMVIFQLDLETSLVTAVFLMAHSA